MTEGMTIDNAIEVQQISLDHPYITTNPELRGAMKLGIEALKRCKYISEHTTRWADVLLPGETKD